MKDDIRKKALVVSGSYEEFKKFIARRQNPDRFIHVNENNFTKFYNMKVFSVGNFFIHEYNWWVLVRNDNVWINGHMPDKELILNRFRRRRHA